MCVALFVLVTVALGQVVAQSGKYCVRMDQLSPGTHETSSTLPNPQKKYSLCTRSVPIGAENSSISKP